MLSTSAAASAGRHPAARQSLNPLTLPAAPRAARHQPPLATPNGTRSWAVRTATSRPRLSPPLRAEGSSLPRSSPVVPPPRLNGAAMPGPGRVRSPWKRTLTEAAAQPGRSARRPCPCGAAPTPWAPRAGSRRRSPLRVDPHSRPSGRSGRSAPVPGGAGSWAGRSSSSLSPWLSSQRGSPGCGTTSPPSSIASTPCPGRRTLRARPGSSWVRTRAEVLSRTRPRGLVPTPSCCCTRRRTDRRA